MRLSPITCSTPLYPIKRSLSYLSFLAMSSGDGQQTDELISDETSATEVRGTSLIVNGQLAARFTDLERPARG